MNPGLDPKIHLGLPASIWVTVPWFETLGSVGCKFLLAPWVDFVDAESKAVGKLGHWLQHECRGAARVVPRVLGSGKDGGTCLVGCWEGFSATQPLQLHRASSLGHLLRFHTAYLKSGGLFPGVVC